MANLDHDWVTVNRITVTQMSYEGPALFQCHADKVLNVGTYKLQCPPFYPSSKSNKQTLPLNLNSTIPSTVKCAMFYSRCHTINE